MSYKLYTAGKMLRDGLATTMARASWAANKFLKLGADGVTICLIDGGPEAPWNPSVYDGADLLDITAKDYEVKT